MSTHIAIFGGSFDPPHLGHALLIAQLINSSSIDGVMIVPSGARPDKRNEASASERLRMVNAFVEEVFKGDLRVRVFSDQCEGKLKSSYTFDLLEFLNSRNSNSRFSLVIGSELLHDVSSWYQGEWLLQNAEFLVVARGGKEQPPMPNKMKHISWIPNPFGLMSSVSSTAVRALVKDRKSIKGLVSPEVERIIQENRLYL